MAYVFFGLAAIASLVAVTKGDRKDSSLPIAIAVLALLGVVSIGY